MVIEYNKIAETIKKIWPKYTDHNLNIHIINNELENLNVILAAYSKTDYVVYTDEFNMHFKSNSKGIHSFKIETIESRKGSSGKMPTLKEFTAKQDI